MEICPVFISSNNSVAKNKVIILMVPNEEKESWHYPGVKKTICIIEWNIKNMMVTFIVCIVFILLEQK